jgi:hypothetical protein
MSYQGCQLWEGQFKDNKLDGFGRWVAVYWTGDHAYYMGMFKEGRFHGYGTVNYDGETRTGYLENDEKNMMWIPVTK